MGGRPAPDPYSERTAIRGLVFVSLPAYGFLGKAPAFPFAEDSDVDRKLELKLWRELWKSPQACGWIDQPWRWHTLAEYCRISTVIRVNPVASLVAQLHRYRDQLGLTPSGLRDNLWTIDYSRSVPPGDEPVAPPVVQRRRSRDFQG